MAPMFTLFVRKRWRRPDLAFLQFSRHHKNGCVVVKAFETGTGSSEFRKKLAKYFEKVWLRKPLASKKVSAEQFLVAKTLK